MLTALLDAHMCVLKSRLVSHRPQSKIFQRRRLPFDCGSQWSSANDFLNRLPCPRDEKHSPHLVRHLLHSMSFKVGLPVITPDPLLSWSPSFQRKTAASSSTPSGLSSSPHQCAHSPPSGYLLPCVPRHPATYFCTAPDPRCRWSWNLADFCASAFPNSHRNPRGSARHQMHGSAVVIFPRHAPDGDVIARQEDGETPFSRAF